MGGDLFGIGFGELFFLAILALLIFGPKRIPEIARSIGRFIRQVRQAMGGIDQEVRQWMQGGEWPESWPEEGPPAGRSALPPSGPPAPAEPADHLAVSPESMDKPPPPLAG